ncbi:MAG: alpha/beta fold hydrolase [Candidatus Omnitrophota bacterium]
MKILKIALMLLMAASIFIIGDDVFAQNMLENLPLVGDLTQGIGLDINKEPPDVDIKIYNIKTKDNWTLSVNRYTAKDPSVKKKAAVILCHGFNLNNKFWDLDKSCSFATYLARAGYDVWSPSLRGSGLSSKPLISDVRNLIKLDLINIPQTLMKAPFDLTKFDWSIDDHIHKDAPAIINLAKKESHFNKVYWIGQSMGGIIMYGYLETENQNDIAGFIPVSSMMFIDHPLTPGLKMIADQKPLLTASLLINTSVASQLRNVTLGAVKNPIEELLLKRENMDNKVVFRFFREAIDDTSPGVVTQFSDSIKAGKMLSKDGKFDYTLALGRIKVPTLMLVGSGDGFVIESALKEAFDRISSKDKTMIVFSQANGYSADYGHCDLILGKNSEKEVYPVILNWLDARSSAAGK